MAAILVIEDNESSRFVIASVLERAGFQVVEARNAEEALAAFQPGRPQPAAVVADVMLGMLPGSCVADRIRKEHPGIPVLFVSGFPFDYLVERGFLTSCDPFLQKPFSARTLLERLYQAIDGVRTKCRPA